MKLIMYLIIFINSKNKVYSVVEVENKNFELMEKFKNC